MYFHLMFKTNLWVIWQENNKQKRKKLKQLNEKYQIRYGLSFYDGAQTGIVVRLQDEKRFFFKCAEHENGTRLYALFDLNENQWQSIDKEIVYLETLGGTHCRYVNGRRILNSDPNYKYVVTDESWKEYFRVCEAEKIGHNYLNLSKEQIIGFINSEQMYYTNT